MKKLILILSISSLLLNLSCNSVRKNADTSKQPVQYQLDHYEATATYQSAVSMLVMHANCQSQGDDCDPEMSEMVCVMANSLYDDECPSYNERLVEQLNKSESLDYCF